MSDGSLFQIVAEEWLLTGAECETECETWNMIIDFTAVIDWYINVKKHSL